MSDSNSITQDDLLESLLGDFLDESDQLLGQFNENLLQLDDWVRSLDDDHDQRCDDELLNEMFRAAHSLKGLSAMLGLGDINNLTHKIENVFDAARKDELTVNGDVVELMFMGLDQLVTIVDLLKDPDSEPVNSDQVLAGIQQLLHSAGVERAKTSQADAERALAEDFPPQSAASPPQSTASPPESTAPSPHDRNDSPGSRRPAQSDPFEGLRDEPGVSVKYLSIFIDEAELGLDELIATLLALEGGGSTGELKSLLVTAHKIKGSAASVGLNRAAKLAHLMEDLLQKLVDTGGTLSPAITDAMLKCTDALRQFVKELREGTAQTDHFSKLASELLSAESVTTAAAEESSVAPAESGGNAGNQREKSADCDGSPTGTAGVSAQLRSRVVAATENDEATYVGEVRFPPGFPLAALKARLIYEKLANLGEVCYCHPPENTLDELDGLESFQFAVVCEEPLQAVIEQTRVAGLESMAIEPLTEKQAASQPDGETQDTKIKETAKPAAAAPTPLEAAGKQPADTAAKTKRRAAEGGGGRPTETVRVLIKKNAAK